MKHSKFEMRYVERGQYQKRKGKINIKLRGPNGIE
jgi:hypothetical protein